MPVLNVIIFSASYMQTYIRSSSINGLYLLISYFYILIIIWKPCAERFSEWVKIYQSCREVGGGALLFINCYGKMQLFTNCKATILLLNVVIIVKTITNAGIGRDLCFTYWVLYICV